MDSGDGLKYVARCVTLDKWLRRLRRKRRVGMETPEQAWKDAEATLEEYRDSAASLVSDLIEACARNDHVKGGAVTATVFYSRDINLLLMVLGILSARVVNAELYAQQAHGPLITPTPDEVSSPVEPWATSMMDQLRAAAEQGDLVTFGQVGVDAHIKALIADRRRYGEESVDLSHVIRAMMMVDQQTLSVICADALLRLLNMHEGTYE